VNSKSYYQWEKQAEETGGFQYSYPKSRARKIDEGKLLELIKNHPDWY
jgi:transposase